MVSSKKFTKPKKFTIFMVSKSGVYCKDKIIRIDKHWEYMWIVAVISSEYYQKLFCMMEISH